MGRHILSGTMSETVAIDLPLKPESAAQAREQLGCFRASLDETSFGDLRLLVHELIVEVLIAREEDSAGSIELRAERDGGRIRVAVAEGGGAYRLPSRRPEPGDPGFGLHLVQRLSDRWGMRREHGRATVWLEMLRAPRGAV
jgi:anti-sigma regulatory factor (Ser/Thr protein kinase)